MYKVKTYNKIAGKGLGILKNAGCEVSSEIYNPDAVILRSHILEEDDIVGGVKCIARAGAGVNNIPVDICSQNGIVVFNTPGANANAVKELTICGLFLAARDIAGALRFCSNLENNEDTAKTVEKNKSRFKGPEIQGKNLGVIGLGEIGVMVANAASELGMHVYGYDPFISVEHAWGLSRKVVKASSPDEIYANCDYVTIHAPLMDSTRGMIGEKAMSSMREGVRILNFSRGGLVDTAALKDFLDSGKVARYVTDFPDKMLIGHSDAVCIPHLGASTFEAEENCAVMAARQLLDYLERGNITNSVNFPECVMEKKAPHRISIAHRNIPNVLGRISSVLASLHINIEDMMNKGKGDFAYTLIDVSSELPEECFDCLKSVDGVIKIRII
jgi:D-3-phosphoglycerate dehydrogenase